MLPANGRKNLSKLEEEESKRAGFETVGYPPCCMKSQTPTCKIDTWGTRLHSQEWLCSANTSGAQRTRLKAKAAALEPQGFGDSSRSLYMTWPSWLHFLFSSGVIGVGISPAGTESQRM